MKSQIGRRRGRPAASDTRSELKEALVSAALKCFGTRGFNGTSLSQIAGLAGTDIALTRYYFGSKENLWQAAVDRLAVDLRGELLQIIEIPHNSNAEHLKKVIHWFVDMSVRHPYLSRIIVLEGASEDSRGQYIVKQLVAPFYKAMSHLINGAKLEGCVPDVAPRTIFFMITHGGTFPMSLPVLTNAFPGGTISSPGTITAHADAIISLIMNVEPIGSRRRMDIALGTIPTAIMRLVAGLQAIWKRK